MKDIIRGLALFVALIFSLVLIQMSLAGESEEHLEGAKAKQKFIEFYREGKKNNKVRDFRPGGAHFGLEYNGWSCKVSVKEWKNDKELESFSPGRFECKTFKAMGLDSNKNPVTSPLHRVPPAQKASVGSGTK